MNAGSRLRQRIASIIITKRKQDGTVQLSAVLHDDSAGFARVRRMLRYARLARNARNGGVFSSSGYGERSGLC